MNLKKTWNGKYGKSEIITRKNSTMERVEINALKLHDGETKKYSECGKEYGITILGGKCSVEGDGNLRIYSAQQGVYNKGRRRSFDDCGKMPVGKRLCSAPYKPG